MIKTWVSPSATRGFEEAFKLKPEFNVWYQQLQNGVEEQPNAPNLHATTSPSLMLLHVGINNAQNACGGKKMFELTKAPLTVGGPPASFSFIL